MLLLLGRGRDKGASCLQLNPEIFYILKGKWGRRGTKEEREKARARQRKREKTRVTERGREKKERRIKAKY